MLFLHLIIDGNQFDGTIPTELGKLENIEMLNLGEVMFISFLMMYKSFVLYHEKHHLFIIFIPTVTPKQVLP